MAKHIKQFVGNFPTNCLSVFDYFVGLTILWDWGAERVNFSFLESEWKLQIFYMFKNIHVEEFISVEKTK